MHHSKEFHEEQLNYRDTMIREPGEYIDYDLRKNCGIFIPF